MEEEKARGGKERDTTGAGLTDRRRKQYKHSLSLVALTPDCFRQVHNQLEDNGLDKGSRKGHLRQHHCLATLQFQSKEMYSDVFNDESHLPPGLS